MTRQNTNTIHPFRRLLMVVLAVGLLAGILPVGTGVSLAQDEAQAEEAISYAKISQGKSLFRAWCRSCHGDMAKGDGPVAEHLEVPPADLTLLSQKEGGHFYFGRVTAKIDGRQKTRGHGSKDMPVWGEAFGIMDETGGEEAVREKINALAHYLRSIQVTDDGSGGS